MGIMTRIRHNNKSEQLDFALLITCLLCSLFGVIFSYTDSGLASVFSYLKYICIITLYAKKAKMSLPFFVPLLFYVFLGILSVISPFSYSVGRMIVIGMVPMWLYILKNADIKKQYIKWVIAILIFYIAYIMIILDKSQINPNQVAFCFLLAFVNVYSLRILQLLSNRYFLPISLLCLLGILLSGSRTSFMVFFILFLSQYLQKFHKVALFFFVMCIIGTVTPYIYTYLADIYKTSHNEIIMDQEIFSGREFVWNLIYYYFRDINHFLYGGIDLWEWDKSYHNSLFDIWVDLGLICLIVYVLIYTYYIRLFELSVSPKAYKVIYVICLSMIWGYFESGWFLGHAISILFPILYISSPKNNKSKVLRYENSNSRKWLS